jgi:uncharacterized RDD family membrane protein YckC
MTARVESTPSLRATPAARAEPHVRGRFRAPFALRCGALLIDYVLFALIMTLSTIVARLMGGGARMAGGTTEKLGILIAIIVAVLNLGVLAGLTGQSVGKWTTGLRIEQLDGQVPGIGRALLRHFVGYPLSFLPLGLGFLIVVVSPNGRALHDLIVGTIVVRDYRAVALPRTRGSRAPTART